MIIKYKILKLFAKKKAKNKIFSDRLTNLIDIEFLKL